MKTGNLRKLFRHTMLLISFALMFGCGGGGDSAPNGVVGKNVISISITGSGEYVVLGTNLDGVAGIDLTINYDVSTLSTPIVTQGVLISGAMMLANTIAPGTIKIAIISTKSFVGSGQIAVISFEAVTGTGTVSMASAKMIDINGTTIP